MKLSARTVLVAAALAVAAGGAGQALATTNHHATPATLRVVMHDPGCHWFAVGKKFTLSATMSRPVRLLNLDEATLMSASKGSVSRIPVGHALLLGRGHYAITMVGQAADDNHLTLIVR